MCQLWHTCQGLPTPELERYLDCPRAVVHHAVLGSHDFVVVKFGGVEGDLLHIGDATDGVGLTWASGLILVQPVVEELLEEGALSPCWHHYDLFMLEMDIDHILKQEKKIRRIKLWWEITLQYYLSFWGVIIVFDEF